MVVAPLFPSFPVGTEGKAQPIPVHLNGIEQPPDPDVTQDIGPSLEEREGRLLERLVLDEGHPAFQREEVGWPESKIGLSRRAVVRWRRDGEAEVQDLIAGHLKVLTREPLNLS